MQIFVRNIYYFSDKNKFGQNIHFIGDVDVISISGHLSGQCVHILIKINLDNSKY